MSKGKPQPVSQTVAADLTWNTVRVRTELKQLKKSEGICRKGVHGKIVFYRSLFMYLIGILFGSYWPVRTVLFLYKPGVSVWLGGGGGGVGEGGRAAGGVPEAAAAHPEPRQRPGPGAGRLAPRRRESGDAGADVYVSLFQKKKRKKDGCNGEVSFFLFFFLSYKAHEKCFFFPFKF